MVLSNQLENDNTQRRMLDAMYAELSAKVCESTGKRSKRIGELIAKVHQLDVLIRVVDGSFARIGEENGPFRSQDPDSRQAGHSGQRDTRRALGLTYQTFLDRAGLASQASPPCVVEGREQCWSKKCIFPSQRHLEHRYGLFFRRSHLETPPPEMALTADGSEQEEATGAMLAKVRATTPWLRPCRSPARSLRNSSGSTSSDESYYSDVEKGMSERHGTRLD